MLAGLSGSLWPTPPQQGHPEYGAQGHGQIASGDSQGGGGALVFILKPMFFILRTINMKQGQIIWKHTLLSAVMSCCGTN